MRYEILWSLHEKYFCSTLRILKVLFLVNSGISSVSVIKFLNKSDRRKRSTFPHVWMFPSIYCLHIFKQKELNWYEVATKIIKDVQHTGKCRVKFLWKGKKEEKGKWENVAELTGWCDLFREQKNELEHQVKQSRDWEAQKIDKVFIHEIVSQRVYDTYIRARERWCWGHFLCCLTFFCHRRRVLCVVCTFSCFPRRAFFPHETVRWGGKCQPHNPSALLFITHMNGKCEAGEGAGGGRI